MISIVTIFSWIDNDMDMLRHNINAIISKTTEPFEALIIDNDALPEVRQWLGAINHPSVSVLKPNHRMYVGEAYNFGISQAKSNLVYMFDSDICPASADWSQAARNRKPPQEWGKYCFNIPIGWFVDKNTHIPAVCEFYHRFKKLIPQLDMSNKFHRSIKHRIETDVDFLDSGIAYQSLDSDHYLVCDLLGIKRLYDEFVVLPREEWSLGWSLRGYESSALRPKENSLVTKQKNGYLTLKSRVYMAIKWKMIRDSGLLSPEQCQMINKHRTESLWMDGYLNEWQKQNFQESY